MKSACLGALVPLAVALSACTAPPPSEDGEQQQDDASSALAVSVDRDCTIGYPDGASFGTVTKHVRISRAAAPVVIPITPASGAPFVVTIGTARSTNLAAIAASSAAPVPGRYVFAKVDDGGAHAPSALLTDLDAGHWTLPAHDQIAVTCKAPNAPLPAADAGYTCATRRIEGGRVTRTVSLSVASNDAWTEQQGGDFYGMYLNNRADLSMELSNSYYTSSVNAEFPNGVSVAKVLSFIAKAPAVEGSPATSNLYIEGDCARVLSTGGSEFLGGWADTNVPDGDPNGLTLTSDGTQSRWQSYAARRVQAVVRLHHGDVSQVEVELSHAGHTVVLNRLGARSGAELFDTFEVPELAGLDVSGPWTLRVKDRVAGTVGRLQSWSVILERPEPVGVRTTRELVASPNAPIPSAAPLESSITVADDFSLSALNVVVDVAETPIGTLFFELSNGTHTRQISYFGGDPKFSDSFPIGNVGGMNAKGTWTLRMKDPTPGRAGTFKSWKLVMSGAGR